MAPKAPSSIPQRGVVAAKGPTNTTAKKAQPAPPPAKKIPSLPKPEDKLIEVYTRAKTDRVLVFQPGKFACPSTVKRRHIGLQWSR